MRQEIRYCTTSDGVRIAYATVGAGIPVVRVLGWLTHLEFDETGPFWAPWVVRLAPHHQLVRYDGRGMGLSDRGITDFSLSAKVRDLEAVVDALGLARFVLLGVSEGAATAIDYAVRHADRVDRLVLQEGTACIARTPEYVERSHALQALVRQGWGSDSHAIQHFFTTTQFPDADSSFYAWHVALQRASAAPATAAQFLAAYLTLDARSLLPQVSVPTLVLHRRDDAAAPLEWGRELATSIPDARFLTFEGRNHLPLPQEPVLAEMLSEIAGFLAEDGAAELAARSAGTTVQVALAAAGTAGLSPRELEVLRLVAAGKSNPEIAEALMVSPNTVAFHVKSIFNKTGAANRTEAAAYAYRHQLVE